MTTERGKEPVNENGYIGPERRRYRNGNGNGRDWTSLRAWAQAITWVGIPGAIAIFLVYLGGTQLPKIIDLMLEIRSLSTQGLERQREIIDLQNSIVRISQRTCSNAAKDDSARQKCFDK